MVLSNYRSTLDWWLVPLAKALRNVDPNRVSWVSLAFAFAGGVAFWQSSPADAWLLGVAFLCVVANGVLDVLDGKLAQVTGRETPKGDYLDHVIDRLSDTVLLVGISFSPWARVEVGLFAILGTLLTSYLGTQAQAVGIGRNYGGLLGRADRMVLLMAVPLAQWILIATVGGVAVRPYFGSLLELMLLYFAVIGLLTTVQRFWMGLRQFDRNGDIKR